jgi:hypothetical protein
MIDTDSKKCDATANFQVGSRRYLVKIFKFASSSSKIFNNFFPKVAFQNPNCQNMTWGDASNFCQVRTYSLGVIGGFKRC